MLRLTIRHSVDIQPSATASHIYIFRTKFAVHMRSRTLYRPPSNEQTNERTPFYRKKKKKTFSRRSSSFALKIRSLKLGRYSRN